MIGNHLEKCSSQRRWKGSTHDFVCSAQRCIAKLLGCTEVKSAGCHASNYCVSVPEALGFDNEFGLWNCFCGLEKKSMFLLTHGGSLTALGDKNQRPVSSAPNQPPQTEGACIRPFVFCCSERIGVFV